MGNVDFSLQMSPFPYFRNDDFISKNDGKYRERMRSCGHFLGKSWITIQTMKRGPVFPNFRDKSMHLVNRLVNSMFFLFMENITE